MNILKTMVQARQIHYIRSVKVFKKLSYLFVSICINIMYKGFCSKDDEDAEGGKSGKNQKGDQDAAQDGMGIGEGEGVENVSK